MTISASKSISVTFFTGIVERFLKKYPFPSTENRKSVITTVKGIGLTVPERRNGAYGKVTGAYRHLTGNQYRGEEPRRQAGADREGSGSL